MKKTIYDIEQIITSGRVPEHAQFRVDLLHHLTARTTPASEPQSMFKKIFSSWILAPLSLGIAVTAFFFMQYSTEPQTGNILPKYAFSKTAFAASLESSFGWSTYDTLHYRRITFYNARYPMQSVIRDIWQYQDNYRIDAYTLPQYSSQMSSAVELKKCIGVKNYDPLNTEKGVYTLSKPRCEANVAANGFYTPTEHTTTLGAVDETTMTVTILTTETLSEEDFILLEVIDPDPNLETATQGPDAEPLSMQSMQLNAQADSGYAHTLHFGYGMSGGRADTNVLWHFQILRGNISSDVFELNLNTLETKVVSAQEDVYTVTMNEHYSNYIQELFETTSTDADPLDIRNVQYNSVAAVEIDFASQQSDIITFTQLIADKRIVEAKKISSTGEVLTRTTVEKEHTIIDQDPVEFFSEEYWKAQMKNDVLVERLDSGAAGIVKEWMGETNTGMPDVQ